MNEAAGVAHEAEVINGEVDLFGEFEDAGESVHGSFGFVESSFVVFDEVTKDFANGRKDVDGVPVDVEEWWDTDAAEEEFLTGEFGDVVEGFDDMTGVMEEFVGGGRFLFSDETG